jgi:hypothetical protein
VCERLKLWDGQVAYQVQLALARLLDAQRICNIQICCRIPQEQRCLLWSLRILAFLRCKGNFESVGCAENEWLGERALGVQATTSVLPELADCSVVLLFRAAPDSATLPLDRDGTIAEGPARGSENGLAYPKKAHGVKKNV